MEGLHSPMTAAARSGTVVKPLFEYRLATSCICVCSKRGNSCVMYCTRVKLYEVMVFDGAKSRPSLGLLDTRSTF